MGFVVLGGMQAIKLEFRLDKNYLITAALFDLEGMIYDFLNNLSHYIIQEQLNMEMQVFISQVQTGQRQEEQDRPPGKGKSPTLHSYETSQVSAAGWVWKKKGCTRQRQLYLQ